MEVAALVEAEAAAVVAVESAVAAEVTGKLIFKINSRISSLRKREPSIHSSKLRELMEVAAAVEVVAVEAAAVEAVVMEIFSKTLWRLERRWRKP